MRQRLSVSFGDKTRRRGGRLAILIVILAVIPGLVAGVAFVNGSGSATLGPSTSFTGQSYCGFKQSTNDQSGATYAGIPVTSNQIGTSGLYATVTDTFTVTVIGASSYEYLVGDFDIGCAGTPASGTITATVTWPTAVVYSAGSVTQGTVFVEQIAGTTTQPDYKYCSPNAALGARPTAVDQAWNVVGGCAGSGSADPPCSSLFLPFDGDVTAGNWWAYQLSAVNTQQCPASASLTSASTITVANNLPSTAPPTYYGVVSFAWYVPASGTTTSTSVTLTVSTTTS